MSRFLVVALLLHIPLFAYPVLRLGDWLNLNGWVTTAIFIPVFFSQIFARRVLVNRVGTMIFVLRNAADFLLGVAPVVLMGLLLAEVVVLVFDVPTLYAAYAVLGASLVIILNGVYRAFNPVVKHVNLSSPKVDQAVRFVQITDVHIGSRSSRFLATLIHKINAIDPDFLCITGDFIDQPGITKAQLSSLTEFRKPIYYTIGNHERYEDLQDILARLDALGLVILRDRAVDHEGLQIIGIDDKDDALQVAKQLKTIEVSDGYSILLYHRPVGLEACAEHGVELMLSGHTHGGQIIPFNLIVNKVFERVSGLFTYGDSVLYVSQGTGTWGPVLRVGTQSEITVFELQPA